MLPLVEQSLRGPHPEMRTLHRLSGYLQDEKARNSLYMRLLWRLKLNIGKLLTVGPSSQPQAACPTWAFLPAESRMQGPAAAHLLSLDCSPRRTLAGFSPHSLGEHALFRSNYVAIDGCRP